MNIDEYLKKENDYIEIENNLLSIEGAVNGALIYLEATEEERQYLYLEEVISYLKAVYEGIDDIRELVSKLEFKIKKMEEIIDDEL